MANKMTKKEYFGILHTIVMETSQISDEEKTDLVSFIDREVELLTKKAASKKMTKVQEENLVIMESIIETLVAATLPLSIAEIKAHNADLAEYTPQKMSALLKKLVDEGRAVKIIDRKKTYFSAVEGDSQNSDIIEDAE